MLVAASGRGAGRYCSAYSATASSPQEAGGSERGLARYLVTTDGTRSNRRQLLRLLSDDGERLHAAPHGGGRGDSGSVTAPATR